MIAIPTARILKSYCHRKWTIAEALAELVDNAFGDQRGKASAVWIRWNPKKRTLTIWDNGRGMDDVRDLFILGKGAASGTGDIGLYGVGGSEALIWLATYAQVFTLRDGRVAHGIAHWADCIKSEVFPDIDGRWRTASPNTCPTELLECGHGTLLRLIMYSGKGTKVLPEYLCERLGRLFGVGLRNGRRLTWLTEQKDDQVIETQIHEWHPGVMEDVISGTVTLDNGLSATVRAGRIPQLSVAQSKLSVNYLYRQIKE